jgi:hypothetical protein
MYTHTATTRILPVRTPGARQIWCSKLFLCSPKKPQVDNVPATAFQAPQRPLRTCARRNTENGGPACLIAPLLRVRFPPSRFGDRVDRPQSCPKRGRVTKIALDHHVQFPQQACGAHRAGRAPLTATATFKARWARAVRPTGACAPRGVCRDAQGCACTAPSAGHSRTRALRVHTHITPSRTKQACALLTPTPACNARPVGVVFQSAELRA